MTIFYLRVNALLIHHKWFPFCTRHATRVPAGEGLGASLGRNDRVIMFLMIFREEQAPPLRCRCGNDGARAYPVIPSETKCSPVYLCTSECYFSFGRFLHSFHSVEMTIFYLCVNALLIHHKWFPFCTRHATRVPTGEGLGATVGRNDRVIMFLMIFREEQAPPLRCGNDGARAYPVIPSETE